MRYWVGIILLFSSYAGAQVYSPSGQELMITVDSQVVTKSGNKSDWIDLANFQVSHLFGIFQSAELINYFSLNPEMVGGIGAIQFPLDITIYNSQRLSDGSRLLKFRAKGKALMHTGIVRDLLRKGLTVALPLDPSSYYDRRCTDAHYTSQGDFWYFFNPYRKGCERLAQPPLAQATHLTFQPASRRKLDMDMRLDLLRGDNDNGKLFRIDVIHGFSDSPGARNDEGRRLYKEFHAELLRQGFSERQVIAIDTRPLSVFTKKLQLKNGREIDVEVRSLLVETTITSRGVSFAKFFRESVQDADVIYYSGHSGLGGNLDIASLEEKAGGYKFNANKRQIFIFDSCSSYSYYLYPFRAEKTRAKIDVVTNALGSYFETGSQVMNGFMEVFLDTKNVDMNWSDALGRIGNALEGRTYLMSVGGI